MADPFDTGPLPAIAAEDEAFVAVYKPPRMHSAPGKGGGDLCAWVFERYPETAGAARGSGRAAGEGGLLHRLDYETSGLVLFARSPAAFEFLLREQAEGRFVKEYLAAVAPSPAPGLAGSRPLRSAPLGMDAAAWEAALGRSEAGGLAALIGASPGLRIESRFKPFGPGAARVACLDPAEPVAARERAAPRSYATAILEAAAAEGGLLILASLALGFRHQIRAQLAWVGLPIRGDAAYGGAPAPRLCLHACRLRFRHPLTGLEALVESAR